MWKFITDLWTACLFIIGLRQKQTPVLPPRENYTDLEVTLGEHSAPSFIQGMRAELIKAKKEVTKPLNDIELDDVIFKFLNKELPAEYKKYLSSPITNIGGDWIIITKYSFKNDTRILYQALPIITEQLRQLKIRAEDRGKNGYIWINGPDMTRAIEAWEKNPDKSNPFQLNQSGIYR